MLIVLDLPDDVVEARVTEEIWEGGRARRWMVWGSFDAWIAAILPAKDARAVVRMKGMRAASDELRSDVLRQAIARHLAQDPTGSLAAQADPWVWGARP